MEDEGWVKMGLAAAAASAEAQDAAWLMERLGGILGQAMPGLVKPIEKKGFLKREKVGFEVQLGDYLYQLSQDSNRLIASRVHFVRGIKLKQESISVDSFLTDLSRSLEALAAQNQATAKALKNLFGL